MIKIKSNEYQCFVCLKVYRKGQTEKECLAELKKNFTGEFSKEDSVLVCDDCYKGLGF